MLVNNCLYGIKFGTALHTHAQPTRFGQRCPLVSGALNAIFNCGNTAIISEFFAAVDLNCRYDFARHIDRVLSGGQV